jgi:hypothetical protein
MGVSQIALVDPDIIDTPSNLRRITGSRPQDLANRASKVQVVQRYLRDIAPDVEVLALQKDVREEEVARRLLDCDVVISTTDTHSSRALINQLAVQYWLPTIDIGVRVGTTPNGAITGMPAEVRTLLPDAPCLWCLGALSSDIIFAENLPEAEQVRLRRDGYIQGVGEPQASLAALNHLAASVVAMTFLRLTFGEALPDGDFIVDAWEQYWHPVRKPIRADCVCAGWRGLGDSQYLGFKPTATRSGTR